MESIQCSKSYRQIAQATDNKRMAKAAVTQMRRTPTLQPRGDAGPSLTMGLSDFFGIS